ncbi:SAM-dependent methyltransferase [Amycolatopsis sp. FDAARGOS 1241]|uniref:SAM-dependent methyltransferase n=1 Tax=Amycolatopsis sp. FDAARGOS 1241 TaxID=2778070 RepID=UPI001EF29294|nr:SAM-dependent methyltransferase [Amycolatopsis sp. FDAARGOS 1241]
MPRPSLGGATARTRAEITEPFDNLELVRPGLVELVNWWPDGPRLKPLNVAQRLFAGGVARKL